MKRLIGSLWLAMLACGAVYAANEIAASVTIQVRSGYLDQQKVVNSSFSLTDTSPNAVGGTQDIGTNTAEAITIGDVSEIGKGWGFFRNTQSTNVSAPCAIGVLSGTAFIEAMRLGPGEFGACPLGTNILYALAIGTNSVVLEKLIIDR
jgi:hypothetical protein